MQNIQRQIAVLAVLMFATLSIKGQYTSFTVKETSGTWTSYALDQLKITFSASEMTLTNAEQTAVYPLSELSSMLFTDLPTSIERAGRSYTVVSLQGAKVRLSVPVGTLAYVYDTFGKLCATARIGQEGVPVYIGSLVPGIYVIRAADERHKVLVK